MSETPGSGHPEQRLPNHASFAFKDMDGNLLLTLLDAAGFACSSGSACKTGNPEPSEVMALFTRAFQNGAHGVVADYASIARPWGCDLSAVVVNVSVVEGERKRVQAYEGVVIGKRNRGLNSSFTVRKISSGEGVERTFQTGVPSGARS